MRRHVEVAGPPALESVLRRQLPFARHFGLALLLALAGLGWLLAASAGAATFHEYQSSFGPDCTELTQFERPGPVAVDQESHDIYVGDPQAGAIFRCTEGGAPAEFTAGPGAGTNEITGIPFGEFEGENQIAVDSSSHRFYVTQNEADSIGAFEANGESAEFTAGPGAGTNEITGFEEFCGVAVDADGNIYAGTYLDGVHIFAPSGAEVTSFADPEACNLAVDSQKNVYAALFQGNVSKFAPPYSSSTGVDSNVAFTLAVDPLSDELYVDEHVDEEHSQVVQYDGEGHVVTSFGGPTQAGELTVSEGVAVDGESGNVYVSDSENSFSGPSSRQVEIFTPPPPEPPAVDSISAANVTATGADVRAQVNPKGFDTHYRFQYVTQAQFEASGFAGAAETGEADLGFAAANAVNPSECPAVEAEGKPCVLDPIASAHIGGLVPDTAYRFRVLAKNEGGAAASGEPAPSFTTFAVLPPGLPDGRAYEMVSPPQKAGEVFPPEPAEELGGSCSVQQCLPGKEAQMMPMQSAPDGEAIVYQGQPFAAGLASDSDEYLARRAQDGWGTQGLSSPLFSSGRKEGEGYWAFSPDLSRGVIYQIEPALSPEAPTMEGKSYANLYLSQEGALRPLVGAPPPQRTAGRKPENTRFNVVFAGANSGTGSVPAFGHAIFAANDALTAGVPGIAPAAPPIGVGQQCILPGENCNLYEWAGGQLRLVNVLPDNSTAVSGAVLGSGRLLADVNPINEGPDVDHAISADGRRIFWSKANGQVYVRIDGRETREVPDSDPPGTGKFLTASANGAKVLLSNGHLRDLETSSSTDLTAGLGGFQGILGASEDLSRVYFVDKAALTPTGEKNANGEHAEATKFNLYSWHEGTVAFIATLLPGDNETAGAVSGDWKATRTGRTARVSPDGRYLAFMSTARLTGYGNDRADGEQCRSSFTSTCFQVFEYDAASGALSCVSCNPTGLRPLGGSNLSLIKGIASFPPLPQPGNLTAAGQGRLFFESRDALSSLDTNGEVQDVYEWEPNGVGSCERAAGCIFLISSGDAANDSLFLDATPSGNDAFIVTREQLLAQDKDQRLDLYDARVGGGIEETVVAQCGPEACKGAAAQAPSQQSAATTSFSGPSNQKPKHHKHKKKKHHKHKKHQKSRSARHNRGGSK